MSADATADSATIKELQKAVRSLQDQLKAAKLIQHALKPATPDNYDGTTSVGSWLHQLKVYFDAYGLEIVNDGQLAVKYAVSLLRGPAALWWKQHLDATQNDPTKRIIEWQQFTSSLVNRFETVNAVAVARDRLFRLRQVGSVRDYVNKFQRACSEIPGITEDEMKDRFCRGLKRSVLQQVEALKSLYEDQMTLSKMFNVAERLDAAEARTSFQTRNWNSVTAVDSSSRPAAAANVSSSASNDADVEMTLAAMKTKPPRTKLTEQEKRKLMQEGRCFYCREQGHLATVCPKKNQGNF